MQNHGGGKETRVLRRKWCLHVLGVLNKLELVLEWGRMLNWVLK